MSFNSTIKQKVGICPECPPYYSEKLLINGLCNFHYWQRVRSKAKKKSEQNNPVDPAALEEWFQYQRSQMTGRCLFCGWSTTARHDVLYKRSAAHLFAKRPSQFPSIALNKENGIELCPFGNSCHTNFDNGIITFQDIKNDFHQAWGVIVVKTKILYPQMTTDEQNKVPIILLNEI